MCVSMIEFGIVCVCDGISGVCFFLNLVFAFIFLNVDRLASNRQ